MDKILKPESMFYYDKLEIEKVGSNFLMKRAGEEIFKKINEIKKRIIILVGPGNNGGDGIVLASLLFKQGLDVHIIYVEEPKSESSIYYKTILEKEGFNNFLTINDIKKNDFVVDAILGNGSRWKLDGNIKIACEKVNFIKPYVLSIDIPTGLDSKNGIADKNCIKANKTIAIQEYKSGHFINDGKDFVGDLEKVDIQIPTKEDFKLLTKEDFNNFLLKRKNNTNKNDYKRISIIGGSENFKGAPLLSLLAITSLKCGSGLAMICSIKEVIDIVNKFSLDVTTYKLKKKNKAINFSKKDLDKIIELSSSIIIGPGLTKTKTTKKILEYLIKNFNGYIIIDADAIEMYRDIKLNSKNINIKPIVILTPHIREFSKYSLVDEKYIKNNIIDVINNVIKSNNEYLLLKGPTTLIISKDETYFISNGTPAQAKAGNGDVLTGVIASLVNNTKDTIQKTIAYSAYICNLAAQELKDIQGENSVLASEIARYISKFNMEKN